MVIGFLKLHTKYISNVKHGEGALVLQNVMESLTVGMLCATTSGYYTAVLQLH